MLAASAVSPDASKSDEIGAEPAKQREAKSDDIAIAIAGQCSRYDPWLFMDRLELSALSQASHDLNELVCTCTPFGEVTRDACTFESKNNRDECLVIVKWKGDTLSMDDIVDYFGSFVEGEEDWICKGSDHVVPLRFANIGAARRARAMVLHNRVNDWGQRVAVYVK